jgi:hypothetical protein
LMFSALLANLPILIGTIHRTRSGGLSSETERIMSPQTPESRLGRSLSAVCCGIAALVVQVFNLRSKGRRPRLSRLWTPTTDAIPRSMK